jgi:SecD/SecF fusion protein
VTRSAAVRRRPGLLGLEGGGRLADWLATRGPDLLARARWWLAGSVVALILAGAGLVVRGPSFGAELRRKAVVALGIALVVQLG